MQSPQTPGVYYQRVDVSAPAISALRMDIAGFVGIATRGPVHQALPVQSFRQFQAYFGDFTGAGFLAYSVRGFFENGGQRCWIVRVASELATAAATILQSPTVQNIWKISASSPGVWGNDLEIVLRETHRAQTLSIPESSAPEYSGVASISGFNRAIHVKLSQGSNTVYKVVSNVDGVNGRLVWVNPDKNGRLRYDSPLIGFELDRPILIESIEYTLFVRELGTLTRVYENLSLVRENPGYGPRVLAHLAVPRTSAQFATVPASPEPLVIEDLRNLELLDLSPIKTSNDTSIPLLNGADGLETLRKFDFVGESIDPRDSDIVKAAKLRGLRALEEISEVSIVAVPDINIQPRVVPRYASPPSCVPDPCLPAGPAPAEPRVPPFVEHPLGFSDADIFQVQSEMINQCERLRNRIALIDPPISAARDDEVGIGAVVAWRARFDSKYAAFYYPWLRVVDPLRAAPSIVRDIPPSGHVAGQYARSDFQFGVHKAPANSPMVWTQDVTVAVTDEVHGILNPIGVNAIRPLPGRGIRIFGARTVSSDPDWRFVNVRRLLMMIEKAIDVATQWATFEPNEVSTRTKIHLSLTSFLISLWQRGALMGNAAEEAFFVKCDEENNPASERADGRLLATVGVAPSHPFEFVILRVGRAQNEFEITEQPASASGVGVF